MADIETIKKMLEAKSKKMTNEKEKETYRDSMLNSLRRRNNISHIDISLQEDPKFAKLAITINEKTYKNFPDSIKDNAEVLIHGLTKTYHRDEFFQHASDRLKSNKEIALIAINQNSMDIAYVSNELKNDKNFVLSTLQAEKSQLTEMGFLKIENSNYEKILQHTSKEIQELCKDKDPIKTLESVILHEQLQKEIKPKGLDFAKNLSAECKQAAMEQSKPKARMKI